jgi:sialic acid synthase SpsE
LEGFGVPAYKVASADLTNLPLLNCLAQTRKPLILSTGMSTTEEVEVTVAFLNKCSAQFALLHCNSTYPAPLHDINLKWMPALRQIHPLVGYSGHERGINVSLAAVALDACIIERHFTLDRTMEGPDHAASLTQSEFARMVEGIREIEQALGEGKARQLSQGEMINRENLGKSLVAAVPLSKGTVLAPEHIKVRSPGQGPIPPAVRSATRPHAAPRHGRRGFLLPVRLARHPYRTVPVPLYPPLGCSRPLSRLPRIRRSHSA